MTDINRVQITHIDLLLHIIAMALLKHQCGIDTMILIEFFYISKNILIIPTVSGLKVSRSRRQTITSPYSI